MLIMIRQCVICGAVFTAPPSSKKITCSPACSAKRKAESHTGVSNAWSEPAKLNQSRRLKSHGYNPNARKGLAAAMARLDSQRGQQHRAAKIWILIDPDGQRHRVVNLMDWARAHAHWFDIPSDDSDRERIARNIRSGFGQIVQSRLGHRKDRIDTYKGWSLGDWPQDK